MKRMQTTAWALQRPTGEIMPSFIRRTRAEVQEALASHWRDGIPANTHWRRMRRYGFAIVRVTVSKLKANSSDVV